MKLVRNPPAFTFGQVRGKNKIKKSPALRGTFGYDVRYVLVKLVPVIFYISCIFKCIGNVCLNTTTPFSH